MHFRFRRPSGFPSLVSFGNLASFSLRFLVLMFVQLTFGSWDITEWFLRTRNRRRRRRRSCCCCCSSCGYNCRSGCCAPVSGPSFLGLICLLVWTKRLPAIFWLFSRLAFVFFLFHFGSGCIYSLYTAGSYICRYLYATFYDFRKLLFRCWAISALFVLSVVVVAAGHISVGSNNMTQRSDRQATNCKR